MPVGRAGTKPPSRARIFRGNFMTPTFFDDARGETQKRRWTDLIRTIADRNSVYGLKQDPKLTTAEALMGFVRGEISELFDNPALVEFVSIEQSTYARLRSAALQQKSSFCIPDTGNDRAYVTQMAQPDYYVVSNTSNLNIAQAHLPQGFRSVVVAPVARGALVVAAREADALDPLVDLPAVANIAKDLAEALVAKNLKL